MLTAPKILEKRSLPPGDAIGIVQPLGQPIDASAQFVGRHLLGYVIHVEQGTQIPPLGLKKASFTEQTVVKGRARKGRQHGNLNLEQGDRQRVIEDSLENIRRVPVESENKATVYGDAMILDASDGLDRGRPSAGLEIRP